MKRDPNEREKSYFNTKGIGCEALFRSNGTPIVPCEIGFNLLRLSWESFSSGIT